MPEDTISQDTPSEGQATFTRRAFFGEIGRRVGKGAALTAAGALLTRGIRPPERSLIEGAKYIFSQGNLRMFFGSHMLLPYDPGADNPVHGPYSQNGDLTISTWSPEARQLIDGEMRKAKIEGRPYVLVLDGKSYQPDSHKSSVFWTNIPHPNVYEKDSYPDDIYIVEADLPGDFGLSGKVIEDLYSLGDDAVSKIPQFTSKLLGELKSRYKQPTRREILDDLKKDVLALVPEKLAETALATALLSMGINLRAESTRRKFLKVLGLAGAVTTVELAKSALQKNVPEFLAGASDDPDTQKILTVLDNLVDSNFYDGPTALWRDARTAIAIEKALEISEKPPAAVSDTPIAIDSLYGAAHMSHAPKMHDNPNARKEAVANYLRDILGYVDTLLQQEAYTMFQSKRGSIFTAIAQSVLPYAISKIQVPWGMKEVPLNGKTREEAMKEFEEQFVQVVATGEGQSLQSVVSGVLKEFGIASPQPVR